MASHNKYTVGYCNPYKNVALLSMRICKIDGWQECIDDWLSCHLAIGKRERGLYIYPTINHDGKTQQYTTYWILQFMWDCGYRIYADQWVKKLFEVNSKWLGKRGTNNTKTGMEIKRTLLQCSTIHLRQRDIEVEDKPWRFIYFIHMSFCVNDFIGCRWAVEHRTKVGLD